ncbi:MAG: GNAT family N-acetyltransferase [Planctomycetaceae bacterium]
MIGIRAANVSDYRQVRRILQLAFGGDAEARLVEGLRADNVVLCELVAARRAVILGQIMFSVLDVTVDDRKVVAAALAPLAVVSSEQHKGIGSLLVDDGLRAMRQGGIEAVIVVGNPSFYSRFGFSRKKTLYLESTYQGDAFMALELVVGVLDGTTGSAEYPTAFALVD